MSKGGRIPTTGGEGQGGGFMADNNAYREPYSNPYRQGGFRVPMGQSGGYSQAGQRSGSFGSKGGQQRPSYNEYPRFPSRGNAKGGIGGMAPPPSSRYNPQRPNYTAQPYRPSTPNFRKIGQDAFANTSNGGFGSPYDEIMPAPAPVQQPQPQPQPPMNPSKGGNYGPMPVQQQTGGYNVAGQYDPNMRSGYGTDYMTIGGPLPKSPEPQPTPMSMVRPMPAPAAPQPMSIPVQQPQSAMMPSKGGYNTMPIPLNQSPNITPARQNSSPFGPRNMRYSR